MAGLGSPDSLWLQGGDCLLTLPKGSHVAFPLSKTPQYDPKGHDERIP
jgi:hypothetical protein